MRRKLGSAPPDTLEDLAREAMVTLFRLSRREALANPDTLAATLVDRVCMDHVRRLRGPNVRLDALPDAGAQLRTDANAAAARASIDMLELFRFVVLEHFKQHDAPCHELAAEFYAAQSWAAVAQRLQVRHTTVIRRWSRCMEQVRELAYAQRGPVWEWAREARIV